jgi:hypothetical protein
MLGGTLPASPPGAAPSPGQALLMDQGIHTPLCCPS